MLTEYAGPDVALLRVWVLRRAAKQYGVGVEDFLFRVYRYCVVEPSHVVVLAPVPNGVVLSDYLMPLTKREKQCMLTAPISSFCLPAVGAAPVELDVPSPVFSGTGSTYVASSGPVSPMSGERFLRHAGVHFEDKETEEIVQGQGESSSAVQMR